MDLMVKCDNSGESLNHRDREVMFGKFFRIINHGKQANRATTSDTRPDIQRADLKKSQQFEPDVAITFMDPPYEDNKWYVLSTHGDKIYIVDLVSVTCSCDTFARVAPNVPIQSSQRYCAHLSRKAHKLGYCRQISPAHELIDYYFETEVSKRGSAGDKFFLKLFLGNDVLISHRKGSLWFEVTTRKKRSTDIDICTGEIRRYGYNPYYNRWSYGNAPFNPVPIKEWLEALAPYQALTPRTHNNEDVEGDLSEGKFPLEEILKIDPDSGILDTDLVGCIFAYLRSQSDVAKIRAVLTALKNYRGVSVSQLALEWLAHGQSLASQNHTETSTFLDQAHKLNPRLADKRPVISAVKLGSGSSALSVEDSERERQRIFRTEQAAFNFPLIDIDKEKERFAKSPYTNLKKSADKILGSEAPSWYKKEAGHKHFGYLYSDFVRAHVLPGKTSRASNTKRVIMDYFASLIILDNTVSNNIMAHMFRLKGDFALDRDDKTSAILYFNRALVYSPAIGVKKQLKKLEKRT